MPGFDSCDQYADFARYVMREARYMLDEKRQSFLAAVIKSSKTRSRTLPVGTVLFRAQAGHEGLMEFGADDALPVPVPHPENRMVPLKDSAYEGRVNPKGIPCLYLSTEIKTAMAEVRPWIGSYVSLGKFVLVRELLVVDCTVDKKRWIPFQLVPKGHTPKPLSPQDIEACVWGNINWAFSEPVTRSDNLAEYAPTQVLAEAFRKEGYGAVKYGSKVGDGDSIAAFDLEIAKMTSCHLYQVKSFTPNFSAAGLPYDTAYHYGLKSGRKNVKARNEKSS